MTGIPHPAEIARLIQRPGGQASAGRAARASVRVTAAGLAAVVTRTAFAVAILATAYLVRYWLAASWGQPLSSAVAVVLLADAAFTWLLVERYRRRSAGEGGRGLRGRSRR